MKVLVTGATGYLGSRVVHALLTYGHEVTAVLRPSSDRVLLGAAATQIAFVLDAALDGIAAGQVDVVVHTATCYGRRGESAEDVVQANVTFPTAVWTAARRAGARRFVNTDTWWPSGVGAYAASKHQFASFLRAQVDPACGVDNVVLQNLCGPGDGASKFPVMIARALVADVPALDLTGGEQRRDFIDVDDAVSAYVSLVEATSTPRPAFVDVGLGTGVAIPVRQFVEEMRIEAGASTELRFGALPYRDGEPMTASADLTELGRLGWEPRVSRARSIARLIAFERRRIAIGVPS